MAAHFEDNLGTALAILIQDQSKWSQETFGKDTERGPVGPLEHLAKEALEAKEQCIRLNQLHFIFHGSDKGDELKQHRRKEIAFELADCLILWLDSLRRAGFTALDIVKVAQEKMVINKSRQWPKGETDKPVEHVR